MELDNQTACVVLASLIYGPLYYSLCNLLCACLLSAVLDSLVVLHAVPHTITGNDKHAIARSEQVLLNKGLCNHSVLLLRMVSKGTGKCQASTNTPIYYDTSERLDSVDFGLICPSMVIRESLSLSICEQNGSCISQVSHIEHSLSFFNAGNRYTGC